jgi:hypothetical protein
MIGQKIKISTLVIGFFFTIISAKSQNTNYFLGGGIGYTESVFNLNGINFNLSFEKNLNNGFLFHLNGYTFSKNQSLYKFKQGGPTTNVIDDINLEFGSKMLFDQRIAVGLESGIGYLLINKSKWKFIIGSGLSYQKLISNSIKTSVVPYQMDMTNFGLYASTYDKNHLGYFGSLTNLIKVSSRIWLGPEVKWRGYFVDEPIINPVILSSTNLNSININFKIAYAL